MTNNKPALKLSLSFNCTKNTMPSGSGISGFALKKKKLETLVSNYLGPTNVDTIIKLLRRCGLIIDVIDVRNFKRGDCVTVCMEDTDYPARTLSSINRKLGGINMYQKIIEIYKHKNDNSYDIRLLCYCIVCKKPFQREKNVYTMGTRLCSLECIRDKAICMKESMLPKNYDCRGYYEYDTTFDCKSCINVECINELGYEHCTYCGRNQQSWYTSCKYSTRKRERCGECVGCTDDTCRKCMITHCRICSHII